MAAETATERRLDPRARPEIKISRKKQFLFTLVIFLVFIVALEGVLRLAGIPADPADLREDSGLIRKTEGAFDYEYTPGWRGYHAGAITTINSAGYRGKEFSAAKPADTTRILGVGDSFTLGRAVDDEDIFLARLEDLLNRDEGRRYETINTGHENMNTVIELAYMKERDLMSLKPDVVVLGFTVHNDAQITKNRGAYRKQVRDENVALGVTENKTFKELARTYHIARILRTGVKWINSREMTEIYHNVVLDNFADGGESWEACREALGGIYDLCRANNVPLVFAIFPVYTRELDQTYNDYPEEFREIHGKLKAVFEGRPGVTVVDMLDDLAATGRTIREIRVPIDGHPNHIWHEIVAKRLYSTLKGMGL
jgi:hypothetical protein